MALSHRMIRFYPEACCRGRLSWTLCLGGLLVGGKHQCGGSCNIFPVSMETPSYERGAPMRCGSPHWIGYGGANGDRRRRLRKHNNRTESLGGGKGQAAWGANKGFVYIHPNGVASEQITLANLPMTFKLRSIVGDWNTKAGSNWLESADISGSDKSIASFSVCLSTWLKAGASAFFYSQQIKKISFYCHGSDYIPSIFISKQDQPSVSSLRCGVWKRNFICLKQFLSCFSTENIGNENNSF